MRKSLGLSILILFISLFALFFYSSFKLVIYSWNNTICGSYSNFYSYGLTIMIISFNLLSILCLFIFNYFRKDRELIKILAFASIIAVNISAFYIGIHGIDNAWNIKYIECITGFNFYDKSLIGIVYEEELIFNVFAFFVLLSVIGMIAFMIIFMLKYCFLSKNETFK